MKALNGLKKIYPRCCLTKLDYGMGYVVYDDWDNKRPLGYGNTPKNAYANALYNVTK